MSTMFESVRTVAGDGTTLIVVFEIQGVPAWPNSAVSNANQRQIMNAIRSIPSLSIMKRCHLLVIRSRSESAHLPGEYFPLLP